MFKCRNCQNTFRNIDEFPNQLCPDCYRLTPDANRPITDKELAQMWGFKN